MSGAGKLKEDLGVRGRGKGKVVGEGKEENGGER